MYSMYIYIYIYMWESIEARGAPWSGMDFRRAALEARRGAHRRRGRVRKSDAVTCYAAT